MTRIPLRLKTRDLRRQTGARPSPLTSTGPLPLPLSPPSLPQPLTVATAAADGADVADGVSRPMTPADLNAAPSIAPSVDAAPMGRLNLTESMLNHNNSAGAGAFASAAPVSAAPAYDFGNYHFDGLAGSGLAHADGTDAKMHHVVSVNADDGIAQDVQAASAAAGQGRPPLYSHGAAPQGVYANACRKDAAIVGVASSPFADGDNNGGGGAGAATEAAEAISGWRFWRHFPALALISLVMGLDWTSAAAAAPAVAKALNLATAEVSSVSAAAAAMAWIVNAAVLTHCTSLLFWARFADIVGRQRALLLSLVILVCGSTVAGGADHIGVFLFGRAIHGLGSAGATLCCELVLCDIVTVRQRGRYDGLTTGAWLLGAALGPAIGKRLGDAGEWRWVFLLNVPAGLLGILLAALFMRDLRRPELDLLGACKRFDYIGNAIYVTSVGAAVAAFTWSDAMHSWRSPEVAGLAVSGLVGMLILFPLSQRYLTVEPLFPLRIDAERTALTAYAATFLHSAAFYAVATVLPTAVMGSLEWTAEWADAVAIVMALTCAIFATLGGWLVSATGSYKLLSVAAFMLLAAGAGFFQLPSKPGGETYWAADRSSVVYWVLPQLLFGAGAGILCASTLPPLLASLSHAEDLAAAVGQWSFKRSFGAIAGASGARLVFNRRMNFLLADALTEPAVSITTGKPHWAVGDLPESLVKMLRDGGAFSIAGTRTVREWVALHTNVPAAADTAQHFYILAFRHVAWTVFAFSLLGAIVAAVAFKALKLPTEPRGNYGIKPHSEDAQRGEVHVI